MEMFSEAGSMRPTAATRCSKVAFGGASGGGLVSRRGWVRTIDTVASTSTTTARIGRNFCFIELNDWFFRNE